MSDRSENGPLRVGEVFLDKYQILGVIGRGGHGCVYRALNLFMGREVAIKIISRLGGLSEELRHRGHQEAALLGKLSHPNIVRVFDAGISDSGSLYIVMELLEGQTVAEYLRDCGPVTVPEGLRLLGELCDALSCAHAEKAIHRDIKPANIFLTAEGTPKILDFGVAKIAGAVGYQTQKNMVVGTILYMSPEQLQGEPATPRSDIYALGLIAFQLFHGAHPLLFDELEVALRDRRRIAWIQAKKPAPRLDSLIPDFPEYVARMVNTAIVKPPGRRFESAKQMGAMARQYLLRYETEVSLGYKVPAAPKRISPKFARKERGHGQPHNCPREIPEHILGAETEQLFAMSGASLSSETSAPFPSEDSQTSLPPSFSEPESQPWTDPERSSSPAARITTSTCSLPVDSPDPQKEGRAIGRSPPMSTSASVSFKMSQMTDRTKASLVAALGLLAGLASFVVLPPPSESTEKDADATVKATIIVESVRVRPPPLSAPEAKPEREPAQPQQLQADKFSSGVEAKEVSAAPPPIPIPKKSVPVLRKQKRKKAPPPPAFEGAPEEPARTIKHPKADGDMPPPPAPRPRPLTDTVLWLE